MTPLRIASGFFGAIALAVGIPLIITSVAMFVLAGTSDAVTLPDVHLEVDEGHLVAEDVDLFIEDEVRRFLPDVADVRLTATSLDGSPLFMGIATDSGGDGYLVSDEGTVASVAWDVTPGRWSFVLIDGTPADGIDAVVEAQVPAAPIRIAGALTGGFGILATATGALLLGAAFSARRPRPAAPVPAPAA
jgi:hypothetical protein